MPKETYLHMKCVCGGELWAVSDTPAEAVKRLGADEVLRLAETKDGRDKIINMRCIIKNGICHSCQTNNQLELPFNA